MFKRVEKRERKREKEEELGLDEEMKQVLGLQDTDSDESLDSGSDSKSDDDSDSGSDEDIDDDIKGYLAHERKRPGHSLDSESDHSDDVESDDDDEGSPPMSVMAATTDPIYDIPGASATQDLRACIVCPGKVIKNSMMAKTHLESNAHRRRLQRYTVEVSKRASSAEGLNTNDPRDILRDMSGTANGAQVGISNRSQRRAQWKSKQEKRKKSRKERKKIAAEASKEGDHEPGEARGTVKKVERRVKRKSAGVTAQVSDLDKPESSLSPKGANSGNIEATWTGFVKEIEGSEHVRPKKRQKRGAAVDISSLPQDHSGSEHSPRKKRSRQQGKSSLL